MRTEPPPPCGGRLHSRKATRNDEYRFLQYLSADRRRPIAPVCLFLLRPCLPRPCSPGLPPPPLCRSAARRATPQQASQGRLRRVAASAAKRREALCGTHLRPQRRVAHPPRRRRTGQTQQAQPRRSRREASHARHRTTQKGWQTARKQLLCLSLQCAKPRATRSTELNANKIET